MSPTPRVEAQELLEDLVALRRDLHRDPEIGLDLPRTQETVLQALDGLPLTISRGRATTSVVAVLEGARPGPTVLLRGDMDALPVHERTGLDFASTTGAMHACGHDLHVAGLVGAARLLCAHQAELAGSVVFMFQPGEEGYGGAQVMLDEGLREASGQRPVAHTPSTWHPGRAACSGTARAPPWPDPTRCGSRCAAREVMAPSPKRRSTRSRPWWRSRTTCRRW